MIIRTYTDKEELINEHKISDQDNHAQFYHMVYVNILSVFDNERVINLCIDLLKNILPEPKVNIKIKQIDPVIGEYIDKNFWDLLDKTEE